MDPFVVMHAIPVQPRAWFLGSAPSTFTTRWRERLIHRLGGLLPVWRGGIGIDQHVESARAVIAGGAVFVQMPEGTVSGPPGRVGPFRTGWAVIALRTDAPIVPLAIAGTEELYLGRRMASRVLPATSVRTLAGLSADAALPAEGTREELDVARRMSAALTDLLGPAVEALLPGDGRPAGTSAAPAPAADLAAAAPRPPRPRGLTLGHGILTPAYRRPLRFVAAARYPRRDAVRGVHPRSGRWDAARPDRSPDPRRRAG